MYQQHLLNTSNSKWTKEGLQDRKTTRDDKAAWRIIPIPFREKTKGRAEEKWRLKRNGREDCVCRCPKATTDDPQMQQSEIRLRVGNITQQNSCLLQSGSKVFTREVPGQVFWQMLPYPESWALATFLTSFSTYYFNVLPFGKSPKTWTFSKADVVALRWAGRCIVSCRQEGPTSNMITDWGRRWQEFIRTGLKRNLNQKTGLDSQATPANGWLQEKTHGIGKAKYCIMV